MKTYREFEDSTPISPVSPEARWMEQGWNEALRAAIAFIKSEPKMELALLILKESITEMPPFDKVGV